jgi:hypothetical protein
MQIMNLIMLYDYMQVINSIRKHYTKNEYFHTHILFSTIHFLLEQKLNHSNYFEKELIMENFLHANDNDFHMYAEFGGLYFHAFL